MIAAVLAMLSLLLAGCREEIGVTDPSQTQPPQQTTLGQDATELTDPPTDPPTEPPTEPPAEPLLMVYPLRSKLITADEVLTVTGKADPRETVLVNGTQVQPDGDGSFSCDVALEIGENTVNVEYLGETLSYTVQRWYTTAWYSFSEDATCPSGSSVYAKIFV